MKRIMALYGKGKGPLVSLPAGPVVIEVRGSNGSPVKVKAGNDEHELEGDGEHPIMNPGFICVESEAEIHCTVRTD